MTTEEATLKTLHEGSQGVWKPEPVITNGTFVSQAPAQPPAPNRKPRSDKGIPKKPPADPDEITLRVTIAQARDIALGINPLLGGLIQDQIIAHLQKRIDSLTKQK